MRHVLRCASAACVFLIVAIGQAAEPANPPSVDVAALKLSYLACDRVASQRRLDFNEAAECSVASEQLLQRGFGGDFDRLLAWWRSAKLAETASSAAPVELARR